MRESLAFVGGGLFMYAQMSGLDWLILGDWAVLAAFSGLCLFGIYKLWERYR